MKTTAQNGGVLIGFGNNQTGTSPSNDRSVYMDNSGVLHFGIYNSGCQVISSTTNYNDGVWHHVAAVMSSTAGTSLYVDGALLSSNPSYTYAVNYTGYWRIGNNSVTGWPSSLLKYRLNYLND